MFFLRCAFFLSIVYVSISCGIGSLHSPHAFEVAVARETAGVADAAVARATDWCAERPASCARDAARLTALVQTMTEPVGVEVEETSEAEVPAAPMPVADPRRRATRVKLTNAR